MGFYNLAHFHFRVVLPTVHEIVEIFMKICFILVPIGLVAAWSCDLAYKTLLIQYTCVVYWRIPHKVVPPDVSVCIGFLLK